MIVSVLWETSWNSLAIKPWFRAVPAAVTVLFATEWAKHRVYPCPTYVLRLDLNINYFV